MLEDQGDDPVAVGARLERVRTILGLTKRAFAENAGMTEQTYNPFESGARPLSLIAAKKLRKQYHLPLEFMYFGNISDLPHRIAREL